MSIVSTTIVFVLRQASTVDPSHALNLPSGLVPLTTKFVPPSACLTDVYDVNGVLELARSASS
jgi:hypothetical protein